MKKSLLFVYILICFLIYLSDVPAFVMCITIVPIQYKILKLVLKYDHFLLAFFFFFCFFSVGIGSITFYLTRDFINGAGSNTVRAFDFSYTQFFNIYSYLILFFVIIIITTIKWNKYPTFSLVKNFVIQETSALSRGRKSYSIYPLLYTSALFIIVSLWMYSHNVGLIGVKQVPLPYHLSGILYYLRKLLFPVILLYLFIMTKDKKKALYILILYAFMVGVSGSSKSLNLMILAPISAYYFINGLKKEGIISAVSAVLIYAYVASARVMIFSTDATASFVEVINFANGLFIELFKNGTELLLMGGTFFESLFGWKDIVIGYQYNELGISGLLSYFSGKSIVEIIPDIVWALYEYELPEDKAFGICIGFNATMMLIACRSYLFVVIEGLVIGTLFSLQNKFTYFVFMFGTSKVCKYGCLLLVFASFYTLIEAESMRLYYIEIMSLYLLYRKVKKSTQNENTATN